MRRHNSLPIIAPAIALYGHDRYTALGDISAYVDYSNCHDYILYPGTPPWGDDGYAPLPYHLLNGSIQAPGKPMVATETGWHTDPTVLNWVSETAQAKYIVRMLLEHQRVGIVRTWLYEMIDLPGSGTSNHGLGLLHSDMTEKPAFKAVKNIIATLRDPGTPIATTALDYSLTGGDANVRSMAFQKRNGSCWVAIWDEKSSWDFNRNTDITNTPQSVTLTVTGRVEIVRTHALQSDGTLITAATAHGQSLALTATDTVQFVEIAPRPEVQPTILGAAV
jgi:hypothetical protein